MSEKLTNSGRAGITKRALRYRFREDALELGKKHAALAQLLYERTFGADIERMAALPEGWLDVRASVHVYVGDECCEFSLGGSCLDYDTECLLDIYHNPVATHRFPHTFEYLRLDAQKDLAREIARQNSAVERFEEEVNLAFKTVLSKMATFSRVGSLLKEWPEIAPFVSAQQAASVPSQLPAIQVSMLNQLLDLPVKEAA